MLSWKLGEGGKWSAVECNYWRPAHYRYLGILQLDQTLNIKIKGVTIPDGLHLIHEIKLNKLLKSKAMIISQHTLTISLDTGKSTAHV